MGVLDKFVVKLPKEAAVKAGDTTVYISGGRELVVSLKRLGVNVPETTRAFLQELYDGLKKDGGAKK